MAGSTSVLGDKLTSDSEHVAPALFEVFEVRYMPLTRPHRLLVHTEDLLIRVACPERFRGIAFAPVHLAVNASSNLKVSVHFLYPGRDLGHSAACAITPNASLVHATSCIKNAASKEASQSPILGVPT